MNLLLTLQPYSLEQAFWRCKHTRRVLMVADVSACTIALLQATMSAVRVADAAPGKSIFDIYLGPQHWLFNLSNRIAHARLAAAAHEGAAGECAAPDSLLDGSGQLCAAVAVGAADAAGQLRSSAWSVVKAAALLAPIISNAARNPNPT
ncbi:hypothetical protein OEZ85_005702 [Tetradesmus obliquus]|uniref:Uncharacterized protein n=1 Tax=Tetradesmus obliquus TaxID=3088 RepID=A0ABY8UH95_TETOB|nr:hypothetical protein OEZ85_005702 [Tetradesmus obliquus]